MVDKEKKTLSKKYHFYHHRLIVHQSQTLLQTQQQLRIFINKFFAEKNIPFSPKDSIFFFIKNKTIKIT